MAMETGTGTPQGVARYPGTCGTAKTGQEEVTGVLFCPISLPKSGASGPTTSEDRYSLLLSQSLDGKTLGTSPPL